MNFRSYIYPLGLLIATACSGGQGGWTGSISDSAGVVIVSNTEQGLWTSGTQWTLEEDLRIGALEGEPEYQFGQIGFLAVDSKNRIFVLDAQARHIRVFSADGRYEQTIGGPGAGPGELSQQAITLYMGPGDTLLVPDLGNARVNRYAPDGSSIGSFRLAIEEGLPMSINATRTGVIAEQVRPLSLPDRPAPDSLDAIVTLGTDGTVLDTLKKFAPGQTINLSGSTPQVTVFSAETVWRLADDMRLLFGTSDDYRIHIQTPEGNLERIITKPFELQTITDRDQEMMWTFFEEQIKAAAPPQVWQQALAQARQTIGFAEYYPAWAAMQIGPDESIWVQHIQSPSGLSEEELASWNFVEDIGAPEWDIFDRDGRYLGVVTMPDRFAPRLILGNRVYGVWRDELDVQYAMRLSIVGL
jgi:hypothetical protein